MKKKLSFSLLATILGLGMGLAFASCSGPSETSSSKGGETSQSQPDSRNDSQGSSQSQEEHTHVWGEPTWEWTKDGDSYTAKATFTCTADSTHKEVVNATVVAGQATAATCTTDGEKQFNASVSHGGQTFTDTKKDKVDALNHDLVHHDAKAATCTEKGWAAYDTCSRCDYTTYREIGALGHDFDTAWEIDGDYHWHVCKRNGCTEIKDKAAHVLKTRERNVDPTCTEEGSKIIETYCEVCNQVLELQEQTVNKIAHKYVLDEAKSVAPTCTTAGTRVYTCELCHEASYSDSLTALGHDFQAQDDCEKPMLCSRCDATKAAPGHKYALNAEHSHARTCDTDGVMTYECSVCHDTYEDKEGALGHNLLGDWKPNGSRADAETKCLYHDEYINTCSNCGEVTKTEDVYRHSYIAKIIKEATCVAKGEKQYICKVCGDIQGTEEIPVAADAHKWDEGTTEGNVTTFHCQNEGCNATKTSVVATEKNIEVSSADFAAVQEVQLSNAALEFDTASKSLLEGQSLKIEVKETTAGQIVINEDIPADTKVYDFSITDSSDNPLAFSEGNSGKVTVRLPYEIQEGEDADNIIIHYVDENGNIAEFEAKYENGYAVFETSHFSYYLVTYMTPAQACEKFGHRYGETIEVKATCLSRGYKYEVCARCGKVNMHDEVAALGHNFVEDTEGEKEATCTEAGHSGYVCDRCGEHYGTTTPALGHSYEQKDVVAPTCTEAGSITFKCRNCDDSYVQTIPAKGHTYVAQTTEATCKAEGKIEYVCKDCGAKDESRTIVLEKLDHNYVLDHETDDELVYKCSYECGETKTVSKNTDPLTEESVLHKSFFTNTVLSIEGEDLSLHSGEFNFKMVMNGKEVEFKAVDSEAHIGFGNDGSLVAYASTNYEQSGMKGLSAIYLVNNKLYMKMESAYGTQYMVYDLDSMSLGQVSLSELMNKLPELLDYLQSDVRDFFDGILYGENQDKFNKQVYYTVSQLCTIKSTPTGYDIILDFDKVATLNEKLATKSVAEVIDYLFGENTTQNLLADLSTYCSSSLFDALAKLKEDTGFDYEEFIALINKGVKITTGDETLRDYIYRMSNGQVDINEYLSEEYLKANSINSLVRDTEWAANFLNDKTLSEYITRELKSYLDKNLYTLLEENAGMQKEMLDEIKSHVAEYIDILKTSNTKLVLRLGEFGEFNALNIVLDLKTNDIELSGDLQVYFGDGYRAVFNYDEISRLAENIRGAIVENRFGDEAKVLAHFGIGYNVERDADGKLTGVKIIKMKSRPYSYMDEYGNIKGDKSVYEIASEEDLFEFIDRDFYSELVEIYKEYADKGHMTIYPGTFEVYDIHNFTPVNLSFYQVCGNKYEFNYSMPADISYYSNGAAYVEVLDDAEVELFCDVLAGYIEERAGTFQDDFEGGVDLASGKVFESGEVNHSYVEVKHSDPDEAKCGELVEEVYACADCGATLDMSYVKEHSNYDRDNITDIVLDNPNNCSYGQTIKYICDDCGEEVSVRERYSHTKMKLDEVTTANGIKVVEYGCKCGGAEPEYEIEGYYLYEEYVRDELVEPGTNNVISDSFKVYAPKEFDPEGNVEYIYMANGYESGEGCSYKVHLAIYEGVTHADGVTTFQAKEVVKTTEYAQHNYYYSYGSLAPVDPDDLSKGYTYKEKCLSCGDELEYTVAPDELQGLDIRLKDLGYDQAGSGFISIVGTAEQLYTLLSTGEGFVRSCYVGNYDCNMNWTYYQDANGDYWQYGHCVVAPDPETSCDFAYAQVQGRRTTKIDEHTVAYHGEIRIGCDEEGQNALLVIKYSPETRIQHNYEAVEPVIYHTNTEYIDLKVSSTECTVCGEKSSRVEMVINEEPLTEPRTEVDETTGLKYVYETGFYMNTGIGGYYVYDADGKLIETHEGYYRAGEDYQGFSYELVIRKEMYGYYEGTRYLEAVVHGYKTYSTKTGEVEVAYESTCYYRPNEGDAFAALFKKITGFDYDIAKYGCYKITENRGRDGSFTYKLEKEHIAMQLKGDKESCTQYNEYECKVCGKTELVPPQGHNFVYNSDHNMYECANCHSLTPNGYNSNLILEDMGIKDGKLKMGYFYYGDRVASLNGKGLEETNTRVFAEVLTTEGYSYNLRDFSVIDLADGQNNMIEIDVDELIVMTEKEYRVSEKEIKAISIYIDCENKLGYFYENLYFTSAELGIDNSLYFQTIPFEAEDASTRRASLVINPVTQTVVLTVNGEAIEGEISYFYGDYGYFWFDGDERTFNGFTDENGNQYYYMVDEFDEETYQSTMFYFMEVEPDGVVEQA